MATYGIYSEGGQELTQAEYATHAEAVAAAQRMANTLSETVYLDTIPSARPDDDEWAGEPVTAGETKRVTYYSATAVRGAKLAGHVAMGRTKEEATRRSLGCSLPVRIRRERCPNTPALQAWDTRMVALGKLDPKA